MRGGGADVKPWAYGKSIRLAWGTQELVPAEEKWQFEFRAIGVPRAGRCE